MEFYSYCYLAGEILYTFIDCRDILRIALIQIIWFFLLFDYILIVKESGSFDFDMLVQTKLILCGKTIYCISLASLE